MIGRGVQLGLMALALTAVAGCAVDQEKEVALYKRVLGGSATRPTTEPTAASAVTLREALKLANAHNERLGLQGEQYVQALIDKDRAFANFLPVINLTPNYYKQDPVPPLASAVGAQTTGNRRLDVPVTGQMNVFNGFRDVATYRRATAAIAQEKALLLDLQATVLLNVAQTYYQILRSEQSVIVLETSLRTQEARVRDIQARQKVGVARPLDVYQTEAQAAATRVSLVQARGDVRNGRAVLAFLTGSAVMENPLTDGFDIPAQTPSVERLMKMAETSRQDLAAAFAATEAARQNVQVAFGQYYPSVSINANYFLHRESIPTDSDWNALLTANIPIFSAGRIHADVRTAWSQLRQANLNESLIRRQIIQDVRVALQNLRTSRQRLKELQVQLEAAEEGFRQADQSYNAGLATNLERLTAQDQLLSAQLQMASEQYNLKIFYLDLQRVVGMLGANGREDWERVKS